MVLRWAIVFLTLITAGSHAHASCDVSAFLNQIANSKRSQWFEKNIKNQLTDEEFYFGLSKPKPMLAVQEGSISEKNFESVLILRDVQSEQLEISAFNHRFETVHQRLPERDDYLHFYRKQVRNYQSAMDSFLKELHHADSTSAQILEKTVQHQVKHLLSDFKKADKLLEETGSLELMERIPAKISGAVSELQAGVSLSGVQKVSFTLRDSPEIVKKLDEKLAQIEKQISADPKELERLNQEFPKVMKNSLLKSMKIENPTLTEKMGMIRSWVLDKEIDIVRNVGGKTKWLEVKYGTAPFTSANLSPFSAVGFSTAGLSPKSYLYQINEVRDILRFLKMDHEIELEYFAGNGMTDDLVKQLAKDNIHVIDTK